MRDPLEKTFIAPLAASGFSEVKTIEGLGQQKPWSDDSLMTELEDANAFHFGVYNVADRRLLAFLLARMILDELHIHHLCTHPDFRRGGIARRLLGSVLGSARAKGAEKAFLEVARSNDSALALYKEAGFTSDFIREKYYSTGDDAVVMSKSLTEEIKQNSELAKRRCSAVRSQESE